jgi:hypothetical protein
VWSEDEAFDPPREYVMPDEPAEPDELESERV